MSEAWRLAARVLNVEDFHGIIANPVEDFVRVFCQRYDANAWPVADLRRASRPPPDARLDHSEPLLERLKSDRIVRGDECQNIIEITEGCFGVDYLSCMTALGEHGGDRVIACKSSSIGRLEPAIDALQLLGGRMIDAARQTGLDFQRHLEELFLRLFGPVSGASDHVRKRLRHHGCMI